MFIDEECGNLIVVNDGGELTETITQRSQTFYNIDVHSVTNVASESISSVTLWNIYCELVR